jgi:hypothetical protein
MAVADNCLDAVNNRNFVWRALGVTTGYNDFGVWIPTVCAPDKGASRAVGFCRYAAGIEDDELCRIYTCGRA